MFYYSILQYAVEQNNNNWISISSNKVNYRGEFDSTPNIKK
jgi:hypothetical protein